jgi:hypothetical protein
MARSPPPLKWKNRDDIYDREKLLIDNIFSTVKMREDLPQDRRKRIGRRILEAAIATAMNAIEPISDGRHDAKRVALLSDKAAALLSKLLDHLAGRIADDRAEAVAHVLKQLIIVDPSRSDGVAENCSHCGSRENSVSRRREHAPRIVTTLTCIRRGKLLPQ